MVRPAVSVLIVNWNTKELTLRCLESLPVGIGDDLTVEVIVVDNGSCDGSAAAIAQQPDLVLLRNDENLGYAAAVNQAYARSSGELVLLLNSDIVLAPGSLSTLVRFLHEHEEVAGAAPLYRYPDGSPQPFHFRFPTFATTLASGSALLGRLPGAQRRIRAYRMLDDDFSRPRRVPQPSASCLLLRRRCLPADRIFDERYPVFFNDVQLARRFAAGGYELWVTPSAMVYHHHAASTLMLGSALKRQYLGSLVRMLEETEPAYRVWAYRTIVFVQGLVLVLLRRPGALPLRDLWKALGGDPGPLPRTPSISSAS